MRDQRHGVITRGACRARQPFTIARRAELDLVAGHARGEIPYFASMPFEIFLWNSQVTPHGGFGIQIEKEGLPSEPSGFGNQSISVLDELSCIEVAIAQCLRSKLVTDHTVSLHPITPNRSVISKREGWSLRITKGLETFGFDTDDVGGGHDNRVEPRMPPSCPRKAGAIFDLDPFGRSRCFGPWERR